jgi:hypothetical protein
MNQALLKPTSHSSLRDSGSLGNLTGSESPGLTVKANEVSHLTKPSMVYFRASPHISPMSHNYAIFHGFLSVLSDFIWYFVSAGLCLSDILCISDKTRQTDSVNQTDRQTNQTTVL